jgi:hypothetical protein
MQGSSLRLPCVLNSSSYSGVGAGQFGTFLVFSLGHCSLTRLTSRRGSQKTGNGARNLVEWALCIPYPFLSLFRTISSVVEHRLHTAGVVGSNPTSSMMFPSKMGFRWEKEASAGERLHRGNTSRHIVYVHDHELTAAYRIHLFS